MATNEPINAPPSEIQMFDIVAAQIISTFDLLRDQLMERRDALLTALQTMKEDYISKETTRKASITELEPQIHQDAVQVYRRKVQQNETPTKHPSPFFSCPTLSLLRTQISEFGELKEGVDYSHKTEPVLAVGRRGSGDDELRATGIALDESNQLIYVADRVNGRIQVLSYDGKFLNRFGKDKLVTPSAIAVTEDFVFVADVHLYALLQFRKKDCKLVRKTGTYGTREGKLDFPHGLCIDYNRDVYVAEANNNRVSVFSKDLKFIKCLGTKQLNSPRDVKVTPNSVLVLDRSPNCVHFFSRSGDLLKSCVTTGEKGMVYIPYFFCLDTAQNILITDWPLHNIKIISPSGNLIRTIGKKGDGRGEFYRPYGICISQTGTIFVISENNNFSLQAF